VLPDLRQYNGDAWERKITFRQCLGHQTPFPAVVPLYTYGRDPDLLRAYVLQHEWTAGPSVYSDINFILLGLALERLERKTIWQMDAGPGFAWSAEPTEAAATEDCTWRHRVLSGEVHDDNCAALQGAGHAGLFGTADAILDFAQGLLDGTGASAGAIALMRAPLSARRSHGWELPHDGWSGGDLCGPQTIGHTGFTGTGLWIDFAKDRAWTLLTNRIHPTRHFDSGIAPLRRAVGDAINRG
jgi:CubicO group peptidase (beta-lactamase class C family)